MARTRSMAFSLELLKSSTTTTRYPCSSSSTQVWVPMNPAPPVTRMHVSSWGLARDLFAMGSPVVCVPVPRAFRALLPAPPHACLRVHNIRQCVRRAFLAGHPAKKRENQGRHARFRKKFNILLRIFLTKYNNERKVRVGDTEVLLVSLVRIQAASPAACIRFWGKNSVKRVIHTPSKSTCQQD